MSLGGRAAIVAGAVALGAIGAGAAPDARPSLQRIEASEPHMGTLARVVLYARTAAEGDAAARAAFDRIAALDARLSDYRDDSEVAAVGRAAAGTPIAVSDDLFTLLAASEALARRTGGAFDVTTGRLTHLWRRARRVNALPSASEVEAARLAGGHARVHLDAGRRTVTLATGGVALDLGGIAKGYAADAALEVLRARGITAALVALGGDIAAGDPPPGRAAWSVAIPRLDASVKASAREPEPHWIGLVNAAVSTSGDAEQWMTAAGVRYSHVIDLRTGWPLTGRRSTAVLARRGLDADALSTAIGVLDDAAGAALLAQDGARPAALWQHVTAGGVAVHQTSNWPVITGPILAGQAPAAADNTLTAAEKSAGWELLFDGKTIDKWNGKKTADYELWSPEWQAKVAASKFKAWPGYGMAKSGHFALQAHGDQVSFKNLKVKILK